MDKEAVVEVLDQYLLAFKTGDFAKVKFSPKMKFISPSKKEPVVGNDSVIAFLSDVSTRIDSVNLRKNTVDYPTASSLFEFKTTKGDLFIINDYFEFDEAGISFIWPCFDPKLLIANPQLLLQFLTGEGY